MDITNQLHRIIENIVKEIHERVNAEVEDELRTEITRRVNEFDFDSVLSEAGTEAVNRKVAAYSVDKISIESRINLLVTEAVNAAIQNLDNLITNSINTHIKTHNIQALIDNTVSDIVNKTQFPPNSIRARSINFQGFKLSGDYIEGGIISKFSSLGIDDKASQCQVTILDNAVVIEQPIVSSGVDVRGKIRSRDIVTETFSVNTNIDTSSLGVKQLMSDTVQATVDYIAANKLKITELVDRENLLLNSSDLGPTIIRSNLRKVGTLEELQTRGETLLDNTVYINNRRMGINTLEPTSALSVWDNEVEINFRKQSLNRGFIGTDRPIAITLSSGGKENMSLDPDGTVTINDLRLGALPLGTASSVPNWSGRSGEILFNDSPQIGKPIGWVCLGGTRWGSFGLITE
jgi:5-carboxymethyl-2-hydroxymuconate isomerase